MIKCEMEKKIIWTFLVLALFIFSRTAQAQEDLPPKGKPLNLEQCIALSLKYQPLLQANQATISAQKARVEQALAAYYPQINFNSTYSTYTYHFPTSGGTIYRYGNSWSFIDIFSMGPTLNQTIYDFGRTSNSVKISRENAKSSEMDLQTAIQTVVLNVWPIPWLGSTKP